MGAEGALHGPLTVALRKIRSWPSWTRNAFTVSCALFGGVCVVLCGCAAAPLQRQRLKSTQRNATQHNATQREAKQSRATHSKAKQNKAKQRTAKYSNTESKTSNIFKWVRVGFILTCMLVFTVAGASPGSKVLLGSAGASPGNDVCAFVSGMLG